MRIRIIYCYFFYFIINIFKLISSYYVHQQLEGNLISRTSINFSIFIKQFTGIVLYGIDSRNKILIELEEISGEKKIQFQFNEYYIIENSKDICGCLQCSEIYMTFILHLEDRYIITKCNNLTQKLEANKTKGISILELFDGYPIPKNYNRNLNRTFIWMGNIGPYIGSNYLYYHALTNQLVGCLDKFYFNGKLISVMPSGNKFKSSCPTEYNDIICVNNNQCKNSSVSYNITDCSMSALNGRFCVKNLFQYNQSIISPLTHFNDNICIIRIDWKIYSKNMDLCLLEFRLRNGNTLLFYVSKSDNVVMVIKNNTVNQSERILKSISVNSSQTLIVNFTETELVLRLSGGENINTFILPNIGEPISLKVGLPFEEQMCQRFEGLINFQNKTCLKSRIKTTSTVMSTVSKINYTTFTNTKFYTTITTTLISVAKINDIITKENKEDIKITSTSILLIVISVFLFFILFLIVFYYIIRKEVRAHIRKISTVPISPLIQNDSIRRIRQCPNVYELQTENIYVTTRDSDGYEILPECT